MTTHAPMPVAGYTAQSQTNVDLANEGKLLEEQVVSEFEIREATWHAIPLSRSEATMDHPKLNLNDVSSVRERELLDREFTLSNGANIIQV